jgi:Bifunctional DNA primase/polymerase, N-terminal
MPNPVLDTARRVVAAGLSCMPIATDGSKAPAWHLLPTAWDEQQQRDTHVWKPYQTRLPSPEERQRWFARGDVGIAVIGGRVSGNLEMLDIDAPGLVSLWSAMVEHVRPGLLKRLVVVKTPREGHGQHLYDQCSTIAGHLTLAQRRLVRNGKQTIETLIETRGEGGYALIPPSPPACHRLNRPYTLSHGDLAHIPVISEDERAILLNCARALNAYVEPERIWTPRDASAPTIGERPGDIYAAKVEWADILIPHGWRVVGHRGEVTRWRRPGKTDGHRATTGYCGDHLYVFSSNAHPFELDRAYSKFTAYTLLNFGSREMDFHQAAVDLAAKGYVNRHEGRLATGSKRFGAHRPFGALGAYGGVVSRG